MVSLAETKEYLRVDGNDEDLLITSLITTAEELVFGVMRRKRSSFKEIPETVRQACLFTVATLYENRQGGKGGLDMADLLDTIRRITFAYRKEAF